MYIFPSMKHHTLSNAPGRTQQPKFSTAQVAAEALAASSAHGHTVLKHSRPPLTHKTARGDSEEPRWPWPAPAS